MRLLLFFIDFFRSFNIQLIIAELMFCLLLKPRLKIYQIFIIISAYCAIPFLFPSIYSWGIFSVGNWFTFAFIAIMILSIGVIWICFDIPTIKELMFYGIAAIIVQHLVYTAARAIRLIFKIEFGLYYRITIVVVFFIIYTLFYLVFVRRLKKDNIAAVRNGYIITFTFFSFFFVYIIGLWTIRREVQTIGSYLFDFFCCILILLLHFGMFEWSKLERENEIMKHLFRFEKDKHIMSAENMEMINMKFHDLKYQISLLKHMTDSDQQIESINELERAIKIYDTSIKTGNGALDVLLSERSLYWNKHNINFTCIADGSKLDFMLPSDIYSLFGNALDNAIESLIKIDDEEKRVISLNIVSKGNYIIISISNYYEDELVFDDGLPVTTKSNKVYHGYGMKSIKFLTEKYGGTMSILTNSGIFKLNIMLPIKQE